MGGIQLSPQVQSFELIWRNSLTSLDFNGHLGRQVVKHKIDLIPIGIPPEIEVGIGVVVMQLLEKFRHDEGFKDPPVPNGGSAHPLCGFSTNNKAVPYRQSKAWAAW